MMLVQALTGDHNRSDFDCGRPELNDWLKSIARQHEHKGLSRTYVVTLAEEPARICGYYALTLAELENRHLPSKWQKNYPNASRVCALDGSPSTAPSKAVDLAPCCWWMPCTEPTAFTKKPAALDSLLTP